MLRLLSRIGLRAWREPFCACVCCRSRTWRLGFLGVPVFCLKKDSHYSIGELCFYTLPTPRVILPITTYHDIGSLVVISCETAPASPAPAPAGGKLLGPSSWPLSSPMRIRSRQVSFSQRQLHWCPSVIHEMDRQLHIKGDLRASLTLTSPGMLDTPLYLSLH